MTIILRLAGRIVKGKRATVSKYETMAKSAAAAAHAFAASATAASIGPRHAASQGSSTAGSS